MKPDQKVYWVMGALAVSVVVVGGVLYAEHASEAPSKPAILPEAISSERVAIQPESNKADFEIHLKSFETKLASIKPRPYVVKETSSTPLEGLAVWQAFLTKWASPNETDQAFTLFKRAYEKWVNDPSYAPITQQYNFDKLFSANNEAYWQQISKDAEAKGFLLDLLEGEVYFSASPAFLAKHCQPHLSKALQEGLAIQTKFAGSYVNDAAITIEWDDMRKRMGVIEAYLRKYPETALKADFETDLKGYFYNYLNGMDNTPLYQQEGQGPDQLVTLAPDIKRSYEAFLQQNISSRYDAPMAEFYGLLKSHQFKFKVDPNQDYRGQFYAKTFPQNQDESN
jgi:hypothetical protein